jgi:hypothetical protein
MNPGGGRSRVLALLLVLGAVRPACAQVQAGVEVARDRLQWQFDAPSSYDTTELVPHFFEQAYTLDNLWLVGSARYRAGLDFETAIGVTPVRSAQATDYDTFFNPGGVVWVAGTTGDARVHGIRFSQALDLGRSGPVAMSGGYRFRLDLADFLEGDRTDTRNGVEVSRAVVATREHTSAQFHELFISASHARAVSGPWELILAADVAPAAVNRLAIQLPDKYPGQTLVYQTTNLMAQASVDFERQGTTWATVLSIAVGRSWNYSRTQQADRRSLSVSVSVGR